MPQMAPMWWTLIMFLTITMILATIFVNYFNYSKYVKIMSLNGKKKLNWTW